MNGWENRLRELDNKYGTRPHIIPSKVCNQCHRRFPKAFIRKFGTSHICIDCYNKGREVESNGG
jgi:formylmethanofuran dehydrogenase subunit E